MRLVIVIILVVLGHRIEECENGEEVINEELVHVGGSPYHNIPLIGLLLFLRSTASAKHILITTGLLLLAIIAHAAIVSHKLIMHLRFLICRHFAFVIRLIFIFFCALPKPFPRSHFLQ